jgi:hypothetical protein
MTAPATLLEGTRRQVFFSSGFPKNAQPKCTWAKGSNGADKLLVSNVAIFRSGTFADSMGFVNTWDPFHIDQMVSNYEFLKSHSIFGEVPVRKGHGSFLDDPMNSLIGWHTGLSAEDLVSPADGKTYRYLLGSYEIFDEEAQKRIANGDWRNRSSEIGSYATNDGMEFYPTYMGFAYVDIPAVEGLNFSKFSAEKFSVLVDNPKEFGMSDDDKGGQQAGTTGPTPVPPVQTAPVTHGTAQQPHSFTLGGQATTDYAAVQAALDEVTSLREFRTATIDSERTEFVNGLASGDSPVLAATDLEATLAYARSLSQEQFSAWKGIMGKLRPNPMFAKHAGGTGTSVPNETTDNREGNHVASKNSDETRYDDARDIVKRHRSAGRMTEAQIKATQSYKTMVELGTKLNKPTD